MLRTHFRVNPHSIVAWMSRPFVIYFQSRLLTGAKFQGNIFLRNSWNWFVVFFRNTWEGYYKNTCVLVRFSEILMVTVCSYHFTYVFQSESTLCICLNVKELLARSRCEIWSLSDYNWTRTHNHLVHKWTLNHFAKLAKSAWRFESTCNHYWWSLVWRLLKCTRNIPIH